MLSFVNFVFSMNFDADIREYISTALRKSENKTHLSRGSAVTCEMIIAPCKTLLYTG
jgi:hypothetical protein